MTAARMPSARPLAGLVPAAAICSADSPRSTRSIRSCMVVAKSRISTDETSEIIPRPYWAAAPDSWISCATLTLVPRPERTSVAVTTMLAWPRPFSSAPAALRTSRLAASSRSAISAVSANCSRTGPIRMATRPLYFSPPRSSVSSAPGRQVATWGMSPKNSQTFSTGWATSKSLVTSMALLQVRRRVLLERPAAAGAAEVVRLAVVLQRIAGRVRGHGHPAHGVSASPGGRPPGPPRDCLARRGLSFGAPPLARQRSRTGARMDTARSAQLDQLGQDRDRDLAVRGPAQVQPGRHPDPVQLVLRHAPFREVAQHSRAPPGRPAQAQVGGPGRDRLLNGLLVPVTLGGHHHHRALVRVGGRERPAVHHRGAPAQRPGQVGQRLDHR